MADANDFTQGGGMTSPHPVPQRALPLYVAPTASGNETNTIRIPIVPIACWRLNDAVFAFDSSFPGPSTAPELTKLASLVTGNAGSPASLFAHADPVGSDDVNKVISDRRAIAVYATLTRQPDDWEDLYSHALDGDTWGFPALQTMLATVNDANGNPYYGGDIDGIYGSGTRDAVTRFQSDNGLAADGDAGPNTRKALFPAYMDAICQDASGAPFKMKPEDFLGGGADPGGKMAMQGCSEFNPVFLLSNDETQGYAQSGDTATRNKRNGPNRRVVMFLFRPGTQVTASQWPCPRVKEGADACKAQFWPDGDTRRQAGDDERKYVATHDTMACRFYDRFARRSPCEGGMPAFVEVDLGLDASTNLNDLSQTYALMSDDGAYQQQRQRAEAMVLAPTFAVLRFTRVKPGKTYSLYQVFGDGLLPILVSTTVDAMLAERSFDLADPPTPPPAASRPAPAVYADWDTTPYPSPATLLGRT